jgi:hypothetical protein
MVARIPNNKSHITPKMRELFGYLLPEKRLRPLSE